MFALLRAVNHLYTSYIPHNTLNRYVQVLQGWFFNTPLECIRRGNLASWASWAFFDLDPSDLSEQQRGENEQIVDFIADKAKWTFPPGK